MVGIPPILCLSFIWLPTLASFLLSFTNWSGIGSRSSANNFLGLKNYEILFTAYPLFWPALFHNVIWLVFLMFIATPIGIFLAVLLDREMRGTRIYQSAFYMPGRPVAGRHRVHLAAEYAPSRASSTTSSGTTAQRQPDRLAGQPGPQPLGRPRRHELAPRRLHHGPLPGRPEERRPDAP